MNILISVCENFLSPAKVMLYSLAKHNKYHRVYIIFSSLTKEQLKDLAEYTYSVCNAELIPIPAEDCFKDAPLSEQYGKPELYFRLLAPYILPEDIDRVLYLDADIIVKADLSEFYNQPLNGSCIAVVKDRFDFCDEVVTQKKKLNLGDDDVYFNSGVILFDLPQFRKTISLQNILDFIVEKSEDLRYFDQDTLNFLMKDHKTLCNEKWNFQAYPFEDLTVTDVKDMAVVHFTDLPKPWHTDYNGKLDSLYRDNAEKCL